MSSSDPCFLVRAKANLPTGTEIRNVALVDFANGETTATDQVSPHDPSKGADLTQEDLITIDASASNSSVSTKAGFILEQHTGGVKITGMSATELLEQIKALSEGERRALAKMFRELEAGESDSRKPVPERPLAWPDIEVRQRRILGKRTLPENVVLAARREDRW